MQLISRMSLQQKIASSLSMGLLLMLGVFGYLSSEATQQSRDVVLRERVRLAETMAIHADDVLRYSKAELRHIAGLEAIRRVHEDPDEARTALEYSFRRLGAFEMLALVSPDGEVLLVEPPDYEVQGFGEPQRALLNGALRSGDAVAAQVPALLTDHGPVAGIASPVTNLAGETLAVLMAELHPSHTGMNLLFVQKLGSNAQAELIDTEGNILAVSATGHTSGPTENRALLNRLISEREAGVRVRKTGDAGEKPSLVAYAPLELLSWGIVVEQDEDIVLSLPQTLERMIVVMGSLSLLVVVAAAWVAVRGLVRPINELTAEAERIAGGELTNPIVSERGDELGRLACTLDLMRVRLKALLEDAQRWNRELGRQVEERTSQLSALVQASQALASTLDTSTIFEIVLAQAKKVCGPADAGILVLYDAGKERLLIKASYGFDAEAISTMELRPGEGIAGLVFHSGEPILCNSFGEVLRIRRGMSRENRARFDQATIGWSRVQKAVGVPLVSDGRVIGSFVLYNLQSLGAFAESDTDVLKALADQASTAIKNSRLFEEASKVGTLRQLDRLKSEFVATASHELRTPLASIKSLAETLLRKDVVLDQSEERDYLASIDSACDRLARIIDNLLTVSRIESGSAQIRTEVVNAREIVVRVVEQFKMHPSGQSLVVDVPADLPNVLADADRLEDILSNLISNAAKYSSPDGTIVAGARLAGAQVLPVEAASGHGVDQSGAQWVELWVADQGIGISEVEQAKLFQRFFRGDNPATRRASGAGLGLYIVKAYVESMGGTIRVESKPSCGSTFRVTLPVAPTLDQASPVAPSGSETLERGAGPSADRPALLKPFASGEIRPKRSLHRGDAVSAPSDALSSPSVDRHKARVLIADDELDVLRATARNLRANGYEVFTASTGEDAIDMLTRRQVDIVFADIAMPGLGGLEVAQWIRGNFDKADLPVVFVTARAQEEDELRGWMAGGDGYVKKPFGHKQLMQMAEDLLAMTAEQRRSRARAAIADIEAQMQEADRRRM